MFHVPNELRLRTHPIMSSSELDGNNGAFVLRLSGRELWIIASDGDGWEHVSVHVYDGSRTLTPRWDEMCKVKDMFWDSEDVVIQYHPAKSKYVNMHPNTLHLWRPIGIEIVCPPPNLVGIKGASIKRIL